MNHYIYLFKKISVMSGKRNPQSTMTSPFSNRSKKPDLSTIFMSDMEPVQIAETKETVPQGMTQSRHLPVFLCLYEE